MKLRLNKLMAGLVMAGSVMALVGCGGGDAPTLFVQTDAVTTIGPASVDTAKVLVDAASGATFKLPALTFDNKVPAGADAMSPADAVLEITKKAGATGAAIADFSLTSGADKVTGVINAGSCEFVVGNATGIFAASWIVGQTYVQSPCAITLPVVNAAVGTTVNVPVVLTLGTFKITASDGKTITITITAAPNGGATISVNGSVITVTPLPTGATGAA